MEECLFLLWRWKCYYLLLWKHDVSLSEWSDGLQTTGKSAQALGWCLRFGVWGEELGSWSQSAGPGSVQSLSLWWWQWFTPHLSCFIVLWEGYEIIYYIERLVIGTGTTKLCQLCKYINSEKGNFLHCNLRLEEIVVRRWLGEISEPQLFAC